MESNIQRLRNYYAEFRNAAYNNEPKKITGEKYKSCKSIITAEKNHINETGEFANLDEVSFYEERFQQMGKLMKKASTKSYSNQKYLNELKEILKQEKFILGNSYLKKQKTPPEISQTPALQNQLISEFFENKKSKLAPEVGFKSVLESAPVTHKAFKKKQQISMIKEENAGNMVREEDYNRMKNDNHDLKRRLQQLENEQRRGNSNYGNEELEEEKKRIQTRLRFLQQENDSLLRQNNKLRSQKSVTLYSNNYGNVDNNDPYSINTRENDLYKINTRNESQSGSHNNYFDEKMSDYNRVENIRPQDTYSEFGYSRHNDSYSMSQSLFSERPESFFPQNRYGINDNRTVTRNKVGFFKSKMIITKDNDYQIAFKKSQLQRSLDKLRLILYVNNKTPDNKNARINYEYEREYYDVDIREKMSYIPANKQAREVLEIRLKANDDINEIIEAVIEIGDRSYKIWVPALFIEFQALETKQESNKRHSVKKTIQANKQFASAEKTRQLLPSLKIFLGEGELWGKSKVHSGPIGLKWKEPNRLEVETSEKWIDLLTFIFFDYRS